MNAKLCCRYIGLSAALLFSSPVWAAIKCKIKSDVAAVSFVDRNGGILGPASSGLKVDVLEFIRTKPDQNDPRTWGFLAAVNRPVKGYLRKDQLWCGVDVEDDSKPDKRSDNEAVRIRDFLNEYVSSKCNFAVMDSPSSSNPMNHRCRFWAAPNGWVEVEHSFQSSRNFNFFLSRVPLPALNPDNISISDNPGFAYKDLIISCTDGKKCVKNDFIESPSESDFVAIPAKNEGELLKMKKAFRDLIHLYGGKPDLY